MKARVKGTTPVTLHSGRVAHPGDLVEADASLDAALLQGGRLLPLPEPPREAKRNKTTKRPEQGADTEGAD